MYARFGKRDGRLFTTHLFTNSIFEHLISSIHNSKNNSQLISFLLLPLYPYHFKVPQVQVSEMFNGKVEKILKGSLDSIPSPSVKIQIMGGKVCFRCEGKTLLGVVNKLLKTKKMLISPSFA